MNRTNNQPPNTTGIPDVYTVEDFAPRILERYHHAIRSPRFESERLALLSRVTQAKTALERVMDMLDGTFDPALSQALDRLVQLRENLTKEER